MQTKKWTQVTGKECEVALEAQFNGMAQAVFEESILKELFFDQGLRLKPQAYGNGLDVFVPKGPPTKTAHALYARFENSDQETVRYFLSKYNADVEAERLKDVMATRVEEVQVPEDEPLHDAD